MQAPCRLCPLPQTPNSSASWRSVRLVRQHAVTRRTRLSGGNNTGAPGASCRPLTGHRRAQRGHDGRADGRPDHGYPRRKSNRAVALSRSRAGVAHCGGSPSGIRALLGRGNRLRARKPRTLHAYRRVVERKDVGTHRGRSGCRLPEDRTGAVVGARPDIAWAKADWFSDEHFLSAVSAGAGRGRDARHGPWP